MPFVITAGFATEPDRDAFVERVIPKVRGHQTDPAAPETGEGDGLHRVGIAVTSQSAARDVCHQVVAFLAHSKSTRVTLTWPGAGGETQAGEINAGTTATRDAEIAAMRVGPAAKAYMDGEKGKE